MPQHSIVPLAAMLSVVLVSALSVVGCGGQTVSPPTAGSAVVTKVIDGDTIEVNIDGHIAVVRLLGVDAPETVHPNRPEQCFGRQAADRLGELLPVGTTVGLTKDTQAKDHFDRLLLYVYLPDGLFVNQWLLDEGLAAVSIYEPNTHHRILLTRAAMTAERNDIGLWAVCEGPDQPLP